MIITDQAIPASASSIAGILSRADQYRLSASALHTLCALRASGADSLIMTSVARKLDLSTAAVTHIADNLERLGFIERAPSESDRRVIWINLTDRGRDALTDILTAA
jgi:MarR family 2-MHQ and catechol resistance regulon transcriptional repressor